MQTPRVSLVMTVLNGARYISEAIQSAVDQTFPDWELIIFDDGSTDRSQALARTCAKTDPRIRVVASEHVGRVEALNRAMALATGIYVGWLDADDRLTPDCLAKTVAFLDQHPMVGMVYTDYLNIDLNSRNPSLGHRTRTPYSPQALLTSFMVFHFRLFRRELFTLVGGLDPETAFAEDYDFALKASEVAEIRHLLKALYCYRRHPDSTTSRHRYQQIVASRIAIQHALNRRGLGDRYRVELEIQGRYRITRKDHRP
ncbi:Glycosyltransferase [Sulfidibacter corallicola]|uniref:Glycosyltransferase n=1 Tax=Sulfidibacter corallicola TaxID=2818388 RepID=A0A8A4TJD9_SULCO|nr:glycosyltransferase [Sulfidibacter corallicola]QTD49670.1 glycosyltransferase [Sulfidibacter corallicola]